MTLLISDNGKGVAHLISGHGLNGMRERLETLGGSLSIRQQPERGFNLLIRLPKLESR